MSIMQLEIPDQWKRLPPEWERWLAAYGLDDPTLAWIRALGVFLVAMLLFALFKRVLARRFAKLAERDRSGWGAALLATVRQTRFAVVVVLALCASLALVWPDAREVLRVVAVLTLILQTALWGNVLIGASVQRYMDRRLKSDPAAVMMVSTLAFLGQAALFALLLLLALSNLGIDVTALVAGLGVGGIAVALAVQNILGDLLASLSIVFDKPFVPGDFIAVGDQVGTVEKIGIKTTRVGSLTGEQLVFSNNDILQSRIRNFGRMLERRVVFSVGVTYQTPRATLEALPQVLRETVEPQELVRFDRAHFKDFGQFALNFEIVYYVLTPDFTHYMDVQHAINLAIVERFADLGVEFAYPTQMLYVEKLGESAP